MHRVIFFFLFLFTACSPHVLRDDYQKQYTHLRERGHILEQEPKFSDDDPFFLVLLVDAKHLDYSTPENFLKTLTVHPNGSRERDVGHAWLIISGIKEGRRVIIEGGHSGELGISCPRYLDTVFLNTQKDPNPVRYLFKGLPDGYFEKGPGKHRPTFAIRVSLTEDEFLKIDKLLKSYHFSTYSLTENQCTTLVVKAASIAKLLLDHEVTMEIPQKMTFDSREVVLWQDPTYQTITVPTPDILEKSMMEQVFLGKAAPCLRWYRTFSQSGNYATLVNQ